MRQDYQLPLRLGHALAVQLAQTSEATGINKSKLCRLGVSRLLNDLKTSGTAASMTEFFEQYEEIV